MHPDTFASFLEKLVSDPVATFTGILALLTAIMVWVAIRQGISLRRVERAYLFAEIIAPEGINSSSSGFPNKMTIKIWNNGKTPAEMVQLRGYPLISEVVPQELISFPGSNENLPQGYGIASNDAYFDDFDVKVTDDELGAIERLEKTLYVVGSVTYRDIFRKKRVTSYCWFYQPRFNKPKTHFLLAHKSKLNYRT